MVWPALRPHPERWHGVVQHRHLFQLESAATQCLALAIAGHPPQCDRIHPLSDLCRLWNARGGERQAAGLRTRSPRLVDFNRECVGLCLVHAIGNRRVSDKRAPGTGARQHNVHANHLARLAGVRDCWNPEPGGML